MNFVAGFKSGKIVTAFTSKLMIKNMITDFFVDNFMMYENNFPTLLTFCRANDKKVN